MYILGVVVLFRLVESVNINLISNKKQELTVLES